MGPRDRPLRALGDCALENSFEQALLAGDGLSGANCIHEQWMRGEFPTRIEANLERLWKKAASSVPDWLPMRYVSWLSDAYAVAGKFSASRKGRTHVYLVLLDYSDRRGDPYGVYVGMSRYSPNQRFDQHKAGIRASGSVLKRGIEVLAGPTMHLQFIARAEAARIEAALAGALADAGIVVQGGH